MGSISDVKEEERNMEVARELLPILRVFKDGSVERLIGSPAVPPSHLDDETGVCAKDVIISQHPDLISARLYLPKHLVQPDEKLPVVVHFHGGGFCFQSAFCETETTYMKRLVSSAKAVAVSIEYRLAPEQSLPVLYQDCWSGLQWVLSHSTDNVFNKEPWLSTHGDFGRVYIGGDSAGANLAHNVLMRVGGAEQSLPGEVNVLGAYLTHPYFWSSKPIGSEPSQDFENTFPSRVWNFMYPDAPGGVDNPNINPVAPGAPSLAGLGCSRLLVSVSEKDFLRERGIMFYNEVKKSGWKGEAELIQVEGVDHAFHIDYPDTETAKNFIKRLACFIK